MSPSARATTRAPKETPLDEARWKVVHLIDLIDNLPLRKPTVGLLRQIANNLDEINAELGRVPR